LGGLSKLRKIDYYRGVKWGVRKKDSTRGSESRNRARSGEEKTGQASKEKSWER